MNSTVERTRFCESLDEVFALITEAVESGVPVNEFRIHQEEDGFRYIEEYTLLVYDSGDSLYQEADEELQERLREPRNELIRSSEVIASHVGEVLTLVNEGGDSDD
jgi:hypothetical protein